MADPDPTTQQVVVGDTRSAVAFDIARFEAAFRALPAPSRRAAAVDRDKAGDLFKQMAEALTELAEGRQAAEDGKARVLDDRRQLINKNRALTQRLADSPPTDLPVGAVAAMSGGQLFSERVIDEARAEADRIRDEARVQAAAMLSVDEPAATGHRPTDFANMTAYVASQLPVAERRLTGLQRLKVDLLAEANAREAEREAWGEVLPLARQQLAGTVIDVREQEVAS